MVTIINWFNKFIEVIQKYIVDIHLYYSTTFLFFFACLCAFIKNVLLFLLRFSVMRSLTGRVDNKSSPVNSGNKIEGPLRVMHLFFSAAGSLIILILRFHDMGF